MKVELRLRTFGELVGLTFSLTFAHLPKLFGISLLFSSPVLLYTFVVGRQDPAAGEQSPETLAAFLALVLLQLVLMPLQQAASILLVAGSFMDRTPSLPECLAVALRKFFSLVGLSIATWFIIGLPAFGAVFVAALLGSGCISFVLMLVGFTLSCVLLTWYYCAPTALIVEDVGVGDAMARSVRLSEGTRLAIFFFFVTTWLLLAIVSGGGQAVVDELVPSESLANQAVDWLISVVFGLVAVVAPVAYYFNLRVQKESFDLESIGSLVDAIGRRMASS